MSAISLFLPERRCCRSPISNVTLEDLSTGFYNSSCRDPAEVKANKILGIMLRVTNGRGQAGTLAWEEISCDAKQ